MEMVAQKAFNNRVISDNFEQKTKEIFETIASKNKAVLLCNSFLNTTVDKILKENDDL